MDSPILRGYKEIGKFLGVSSITASKLAREHGLPVTKVRDKFCASKNALEAWVIKNRIIHNRFSRKKRVRICEVFTEEMTWKEIDFKYIRKGQTFRLFEPETGEPVKGVDGDRVFVAKEDPYLTRPTQTRPYGDVYNLFNYAIKVEDGGGYERG